MENIKCAFFSKEYDIFHTLIHEQQTTNKQFQFYKANYKWADDNTGKPDFEAKIY